MTRSCTVSSSSARGAASTPTSARGISARIASATCSFSASTRSSGSVRLTATITSTNSLSPTGRTRTPSTATTPRTRPATRRTVSAEPAGAVSVSVSMVRRPSRQPAMQTNTATTRAAAESAHWIAQRHAAEPDQHRDRRPHVGAEMQRVGLQRLARGFAGHAVEQAGAEEIDHDRNDDHREGRERRLHRHGLGRRAAASPPPRSPRRTARTAARSRPAPRRFRPCRGRSDAPRRRACRRCARRNRSSPSRQNRSANARPRTGWRASR